jgi:hypothetical protein
MSEKTEKTRVATWDESKLLETGVIKLVYDKSLNLAAVEIDLTLLTAPNDLKWGRLSDILKYSICNGVKQKVVDSIAAKSEKAGYTHKERREIIVENWTRLSTKFLWNKPAEGRGGAGVTKDERAIKTLEDMTKQLIEMAEKQPDAVKGAMLASIPMLKVDDKTLVEWQEIQKERLAEKAKKKEEVTE